MQKLLWNISWLVLRPLMRFFCRFKIIGHENIRDAEIPAILTIAVHANIFDAYIVGAALPFNSGFFPVRFMIRRKIFDIPLIRPILKIYGAFKVIRGMGILKALEPAINLIKQKYSIGIFVEGKISMEGELRKARPGAAALSFLTGASIIPVALQGTHQIRNPLKFIFTQRKIIVSFGKPIKPTDFNLPENKNLESQEAVEKFTKIIEDQIKILLHKNFVSAGAERKKLYFRALKV
jgi:1-acyl-sn-glycerol-3-phosphate acyltransferase